MPPTSLLVHSDCMDPQSGAGGGSRTGLMCFWDPVGPGLRGRPDLLESACFSLNPLKSICLGGGLAKPYIIYIAIYYCHIHINICIFFNLF